LPVGPFPFDATFSDISHAVLTIGTRLAAALAAFALITAVVRLLCRKRIISYPLGGLVKWLGALGLLWGLERSLPADIAASATRAFTIASLAAAWMAARHGVDFFFAKISPARGSGKPGRHILHDLIKFLILAVLAGWGLKQLLDVQIGSLLTSSAILTAIIGLSMQDTIGSLFSGLLLQIEKPFEEGDWIRVGAEEGRVTEVTWRYTKVVTGDGNEVLVPNNAVAKDRLVNFSRPDPTLWQVLYVPAPTDTPPVKVKAAILTALARAEGVVRRPAPAVRLHEIQPDRIMYAASFMVSSFNNRVAANDTVLSAIWYQFLENGIEIPVPTQRVFTEERTTTCVSPEYKDALAGVELLSGMSDADLEMFARASTVRRFAKGQTIMARGDSGTTMSIILAGQVGVYVDSKELARLMPGQIFGEMALLTGEPRKADIRALEPTRCMEVDREGFRMALAKHPVIVERVRAIFSARAAANHNASAPDASDEAGTLFARFRKLFL